MADEPIFASPVTATYEPNPDARLALHDESAMAKIVVRATAGSGVPARLGPSFGSSARTGEVLVAGTRPDEWILIGHDEDVDHLLADLAGEDLGVVDWTHARALFRLSGGPATSALEKVCGIDWSERMTPDGAVTSGSVAKVTCDIVRNDLDETPSYLILCDRSFGQYLFDAVLDAADEFGVTVA